ncbi:MAG: glycosyltransferase [Bacteroidales bacterium]|jgi:glycosyltransferase involved in cell wall biosynthesis
MNTLFLIFHGFEEYNGISKKITYQVRALKNCGLSISICYLSDENNHKIRMIDNNVLKDYGCGIKGKILKRIENKSIVDYVKKNNIKFIYVRSDHNANPFTIHLMKQFKKLGTKVAMEIPTYPYDNEYQHASKADKIKLCIDKIFRRSLSKYIDRFVTFTDYQTIFGRPTIKISNGIDFSQIKTKSMVNDCSKVLNLIGVAQIHFWHGFDRLIIGLAEYYSAIHKKEVFFHIVGEGLDKDVLPLKSLVSQHNLSNNVIFHGYKSGDELDILFEKCDMGVASLARHRSKITKIKTLKNREYAARGIPFIYSEKDEDFDNMPYIMKIAPDESPIDIKEIISFYDSVLFTPQEIRSSIENHLSWDCQMKKVVEQINNM